MLEREILHIDINTDSFDKGIAKIERAMKKAQSSAEEGINVQFVTNGLKLKQQIVDLQRNMPSLKIDVDFKHLSNELELIEEIMKRKTYNAKISFDPDYVRDSIKNLQRKMEATYFTASVFAELDPKSVNQIKNNSVDIAVGVDFADTKNQIAAFVAEIKKDVDSNIKLQAEAVGLDDVLKTVESILEASKDGNNLVIKTDDALKKIQTISKKTQEWVASEINNEVKLDTTTALKGLSTLNKGLQQLESKTTQAKIGVQFINLDAYRLFLESLELLEQPVKASVKTSVTGQKQVETLQKSLDILGGTVVTPTVSTEVTNLDSLRTLENFLVELNSGVYQAKTEVVRIGQLDPETLKASLESLTAPVYEVKTSLSVSGLAEFNKLETALFGIDGFTAKPSIAVGLSGLEKLETLESAIIAWDGSTTDILINVSLGGISQLTELESRLQVLDNSTPNVDITVTSNDGNKINELEQQIKEIAQKNHVVDVQVDTSKATASLENLEAQIADIKATNADVSAQITAVRVSGDAHTQLQTAIDGLRSYASSNKIDALLSINDTITSEQTASIDRLANQIKDRLVQGLSHIDGAFQNIETTRLDAIGLKTLDNLGLILKSLTTIDGSEVSTEFILQNRETLTLIESALIDLTGETYTINLRVSEDSLNALRNISNAWDTLRQSLSGELISDAQLQKIRGIGESLANIDANALRQSINQAVDSLSSNELNIKIKAILSNVDTLRPTIQSKLKEGFWIDVNAATNNISSQIDSVASSAQINLKGDANQEISQIVKWLTLLDEMTVNPVVDVNVLNADKVEVLEAGLNSLEQETFKASIEIDTSRVQESIQEIDRFKASVESITSSFYQAASNISSSLETILGDIRKLNSDASIELNLSVPTALSSEQQQSIDRVAETLRAAITEKLQNLDSALNSLSSAKLDSLGERFLVNLGEILKVLTLIDGTQVGVEFELKNREHLNTLEDVLNTLSGESYKINLSLNSEINQKLQEVSDVWVKLQQSFNTELISAGQLAGIDKLTSQLQNVDFSGIRNQLNSVLDSLNSQEYQVKLTAVLNNVDSLRPLAEREFQEPIRVNLVAGNQTASLVPEITFNDDITSQQQAAIDAIADKIKTRLNSALSNLDAAFQEINTSQIDTVGLKTLANLGEVLRVLTLIEGTNVSVEFKLLNREVLEVLESAISSLADNTNTVNLEINPSFSQQLESIRNTWENLKNSFASGLIDENQISSIQRVSDALKQLDVSQLRTQIEQAIQTLKSEEYEVKFKAILMNGHTLRPSIDAQLKKGFEIDVIARPINISAPTELPQAETKVNIQNDVDGQINHIISLLNQLDSIVKTPRVEIQIVGDEALQHTLTTLSSLDNAPANIQVNTTGLDNVESALSSVLKSLTTIDGSEFRVSVNLVGDIRRDLEAVETGLNSLAAFDSSISIDVQGTAQETLAGIPNLLSQIETAIVTTAEKAQLLVEGFNKLGTASDFPVISQLQQVQHELNQLADRVHQAQQSINSLTFTQEGIFNSLATQASAAGEQVRHTLRDEFNKLNLSDVLAEKLRQIPTTDLRLGITTYVENLSTLRTDINEVLDGVFDIVINPKVDTSNISRELTQTQTAEIQVPVVFHASEQSISNVLSEVQNRLQGHLSFLIEFQGADAVNQMLQPLDETTNKIQHINSLLDGLRQSGNITPFNDQFSIIQQLEKIRSLIDEINSKANAFRLDTTQAENSLNSLIDKLNQAFDKTLDLTGMPDTITVISAPPQNSSQAQTLKQEAENQPRSAVDPDYIQSIKKELSTAKGVATKAEKGKSNVETINKYFDSLSDAVNQLSEANQDDEVVKLLGNINETLTRLQPYTSEGEETQSLSEISDLLEQEVRDLFDGWDMSDMEGVTDGVTDSFKMLAKKVTFLVSKLSGFDGKDSTKFFGSIQPWQSQTARGLAQPNTPLKQTEIHIRPDILKDLGSGKEVSRDNLVTLLHEIRHSMQFLAKYSDKSFDYITEAKNPAEVFATRKLAKYPDDPNTQRMEKDAFIFAERYVNDFAKQLGLVFKDESKLVSKLTQATDLVNALSRSIEHSKKLLNDNEFKQKEPNKFKKVSENLPKLLENRQNAQKAHAKLIEETRAKYKPIASTPTKEPTKQPPKATPKATQHQNLSNMDAGVYQKIALVLGKFLDRLDKAFAKGAAEFERVLQDSSKLIKEDSIALAEEDSDFSLEGLDFDELDRLAQSIEDAAREMARSIEALEVNNTDSASSDDAENNNRRRVPLDRFSLPPIRSSEPITPTIGNLGGTLNLNIQELEQILEQQVRQNFQEFNADLSDVFDDVEDLANIERETQETAARLRAVEESVKTRQRLEENLKRNSEARQARRQAQEGSYTGGNVRVRDVERVLVSNEGSTSIADQTQQRNQELAIIRQQEAVIARREALLRQEQQVQREAAQLAAREETRARLLANINQSRQTREARVQANERNLYGNGEEDRLAVLTEQQRMRATNRAVHEQRIAAERDLVEALRRREAQELEQRRTQAGLHGNIDDELGQAYSRRNNNEQRESVSRRRNSTRAVSNAAVTGIEIFNSQLGNSIRLVSEFYRDLNEAREAGETFGNVLARLKLPLSILGLGAVLGGLLALSVPLINEMQKLEKSLAALDVNIPVDGLEKVQEVALKTGASVSDMARQFAKFTTATVDTNLESQASSIFESLANYGAIVAASQDEMNRGYIALSQIAAKGRVSLEELNGQLSEAIPGASNLAARGMGITRREMFSLAEAGDLLAEDLLPALADELNRVSRQAEKNNIPTLGQEVAKLSQKFKLLASSITETPLNLITKLLAGLNESLLGVTLSTTAGVVIFGMLASALLLLTGKLVVAGVALLGFNTIMAASMALLKMATLYVLPLVVAFGALAVALEEIDGGKPMESSTQVFESNAEAVKNYRLELEAALSKLQELSEAQKNQKPPNPKYQNLTPQENAAIEEQNSTWWGRVKSRAGANARLLKSKKSLGQKIKGVFNNATAFSTPGGANEASKASLNESKGTKVQKAVDENAKLLDSYESLLAEINKLNEARKEGREIGEDEFKNAKALEEYQARLEGLNKNVEAYQMALAAVKSVQADGNFEREIDKFIEIQNRLSDIAQDNPEVLVDFDFSSVRSPDTVIKELKSMLADVQSEVETLNVPIDLAGAEALKKSITEELKNLPDSSPQAERLKLQLRDVNAVLAIGAELLVKQERLMTNLANKTGLIKRLQEESKQQTQLAASMAEAQLMEQALQKGAMSSNEVYLERQKIQAAAHAARMRQLKEELKLVQETSKTEVAQDDVRKIKALLGDTASIQKVQIEGQESLQFDITQATMAELDKILAQDEGDLGLRKSVIDFVSTVKETRLGNAEEYIQAVQGLNDIQFDIRGQLKEKAEEIQDKFKDLLNNMDNALEQVITQFDSTIQSINRAIEDLSFEIEALEIKGKFRKARASIDDSLAGLEEDNPFVSIGQSIQELMTIQETRLNEALDIDKDKLSIKREFEDGVAAINKAFDDYLKAFNEFQNNLLEAKQEKAKNEAQKENTSNEAVQKLAANLNLLDNTNLDQLISIVQDQTLKNEIISSKQTNNLVAESQKLKAEAEKQTSETSKQSSSLNSIAVSSAQALTKLDNLAVKEAAVAGLDPLLAVTVQIRDKLNEICEELRNGGYASEAVADSETVTEPSVNHPRRPSAADLTAKLTEAINERARGIQMQESGMADFAKLYNQGDRDKTDAAINTFADGAQTIQRAESAILTLQQELSKFGQSVSVLAEGETAARKLIAEGFEAIKIDSSNYAVLETKEAVNAFKGQEAQSREIPYNLLQKIGNKTGYSTIELRKFDDAQLTKLAEKAKVNIEAYVQPIASTTTNESGVASNPPQQTQLKPSEELLQTYVKQVEVKKADAILAQEKLKTERELLNTLKLEDSIEASKLATNSVYRANIKDILNKLSDARTIGKDLEELQQKQANPALYEFVENSVQLEQDRLNASKDFYESQLKRYQLTKSEQNALVQNLKTQLLSTDLDAASRANLEEQINLLNVESGKLAEKALIAEAEIDAAEQKLSISKQQAKVIGQEYLLRKQVLDREKEILDVASSDPYLNPARKAGFQKRLKEIELESSRLDRASEKAKESVSLDPNLDFNTELKKSLDYFAELDNIELKNFEKTLDTVATKLRQSVGDTVGKVLSIDFTEDGGKTVGEQLIDLVDSGLKELQSWAGARIGEYVNSLLFGNDDASRKAEAATQANEIKQTGDIIAQATTQATQAVTNATVESETTATDKIVETKKANANKIANAVAYAGAGATALAGIASGNKTAVGAGIGSILGGIIGGFTGLGVQNGMVLGGALGGGAAQIFADGGSVALDDPNALKIDKALEMERMLTGKTPVLGVLHEGEQVLSTKNKDAQAFRSLQEHGIWENLKNNLFANGGAVGNSPMLATKVSQTTDNSRKQNVSQQTVNNFNMVVKSSEVVPVSKEMMEARKRNFFM